MSDELEEKVGLLDELLDEIEERLPNIATAVESYRHSGEVYTVAYLETIGLWLTSLVLDVKRKRSEIESQDRSSFTTYPDIS